jgi:hypothetical protein
MEAEVNDQLHAPAALPITPAGNRTPAVQPVARRYTDCDENI